MLGNGGFAGEAYVRGARERSKRRPSVSQTSSKRKLRSPRRPLPAGYAPLFHQRESRPVAIAGAPEGDGE